MNHWFEYWEFWNRLLFVLQTIAFIATAIGIMFAWQTLEHQKMVDSVRFVDDISQRVSNPKYDKIMNAIEGPDYDIHNSDYPLLKPIGKFTPDDISEYINYYDTLGNLYRDGLVNQMAAYDETSYDVEKTYCNKDVQIYIKNLRSVDGPVSGRDAFYSGFEYLAKAFLQKEKRTCASLDKK